MATIEELSDTVTQQQGLINKLTEYVQKLVQQGAELRQRLENTSTFVAVMVKTINENRPLNLTELRESHASYQTEQLTTVFNNAEKNNLVTRSEAVTDKSILLVQEFNENRQEVNRRQELQMQATKDELKHLFLGKKVGDEVGFFADGQLKAVFLVHDIFEPTEVVQQKFDTVNTDSQATVSQ